MGLYNFVRGCRWAYKRDELYPKGLIIMRNIKKETSRNEQRLYWQKNVLKLKSHNNSEKRHVNTNGRGQYKRAERETAAEGTLWEKKQQKRSIRMKTCSLTAASSMTCPLKAPSYQHREIHKVTLSTPALTSILVSDQWKKMLLDVFLMSNR